jgi:hypothetical protein
MKRLVSTLLVTASLMAGMAVNAADDIKLKLTDAKIKGAEGVSADGVGYNDGEEKIFFYAPGDAAWTFKVETEGEYTLVVKASCDAAKNENAKFKLTVNGKTDEKDTALKNTEAEDIKVTIKLKAGENKLSIAFTNDEYKEGEYDRNLYIHAMTVKAKEVAKKQ